jgi:RNA polymerase sigma-70 factor (ECF subfamily)
MKRKTHPYDKLSDEDLMAHIRDRDRLAFEVLYDRYSRLMYNYFYRMLWKDKERARDFAQDLFSKVIHHSEQYDVTRSFKTWLYSVAHNMCKNEYAKHEVRQRAASELKYEESSQFAESGKSMDRKLFNEKLKEALQEMDEVKRTTFELRFYQELSIPEISEVMQCSEGTVKSRLFYLLKDLHKKLKMFEGIAAWLAIFMMSVEILMERFK